MSEFKLTTVEEFEELLPDFWRQVQRLELTHGSFV